MDVNFSFYSVARCDDGVWKLITDAPFFQSKAQASEFLLELYSTLHDSLEMTASEFLCRYSRVHVCCSGSCAVPSDFASV